MRSLLTLLFLCLTLLVLPAGRSTAQTTPNSIEGTIRGQIDAFLVDDFPRAFTFASPMIQGIFGTPENFGAMVSQGYPMVHHPTAVRMLEQREVSGQIWQRIMVTDQAGATHMLDYQMIKSGAGWQINGVQLLPSVGVGA
jgi:hypothetical protein